MIRWNWDPGSWSHRRGKNQLVSARAAAGAQISVYLCHVPRGGQHRRAMLVGLHRPSAARAAVADGVEPIEHRIFVVVDTIEHVHSLCLHGWRHLRFHGGKKRHSWPVPRCPRRRCAHRSAQGIIGYPFHLRASRRVRCSRLLGRCRTASVK
jgi:hypothetical protein